MRGKAQRVARRAQTRLQNSGVTGPQLTKFFSDVEGVIGCIKACVRVESSRPLWNACQRSQWCMPIFADSR